MSFFIFRYFWLLASDFMGKTISARVQLLWLSLAHAAVDAYALMVPFLLPILLARLAPADKREFFAGMFAATGAISTSLGQMGFAFLADRAKSPVYLWGGLAVAACGMSLVGLAPSLESAFLLVLVGGLGVAAFHPPATVAAARLAQGAHGFGVSFFITAGNVGQAVGPFFLIYAFAHWGASAFAPTMIPGILLALVLVGVLPGIVNGNFDSGAHKKVKTRIPYRPLAILYLLVFLRTLTFTGLLNFMSLYLKDAGLSDLARAGVMSGFIFFGSMGILLGGSLSDRLPQMPLLWGSLLLPVPLFAGALHVEGVLFIALLVLGNFLFQFSTPIYIVMGQETMPERANFATSLMMGAAWGTAGLLNLPVGAIANSYGLIPTLMGLALLPLPASALLVFLPRQKARAVEVSAR